VDLTAALSEPDAVAREHVGALSMSSSTRRRDLARWPSFRQCQQGPQCSHPWLSTVSLKPQSHPLTVMQGLELAVPGTYLIGEPVVTIAAFAPQLTVITSKQRPRRLTIHGSDGAEYMFLLKGHEDLRQVLTAISNWARPDMIVLLIINLS